MLTMLFFIIVIIGGTFLLFGGALIIQLLENLWNHIKEIFHRQ
jgi:hypothetical protein